MGHRLILTLPSSPEAPLDPWQPTEHLPRRPALHWAERLYGVVTLGYAGLMVALAITIMAPVREAVPPFALLVAACLVLGTLGAAPGVATLLGWPQARTLFLAWSLVTLLAVAGVTSAFTERVQQHPDLFVLVSGWPAMCLAAFGLAFGRGAPREA